MSNGKIEIEMSNGAKKFLKDLTSADLTNIKLTERDGKSYLTMKSEVVNETPTHFTERRLYKWNVMPNVVMYDLKYAKTLEGLKKDLTEKKVYDHAIRDFIIGQDKEHNGITTGKAPDEKLLAQAEKLGLPAEVIAQMKKALKESGFGK